MKVMDLIALVSTYFCLHLLFTEKQYVVLKFKPLAQITTYAFFLEIQSNVTRNMLREQIKPWLSDLMLLNKITTKTINLVTYVSEKNPMCCVEYYENIS